MDWRFLLGASGFLVLALCYDAWIERRWRRMVAEAKRHNAIAQQILSEAVAFYFRAEDHAQDHEHLG